MLESYTPTDLVAAISTTSGYHVRLFTLVSGVSPPISGA